MKKILAVLLLLCGSALAQVPVSLGTYPQFVSILPSGAMNAFGCVGTYYSGTTTPLATYTDYSGVTLNPDPTPLSAGGTANIWFQSGLIYSVVIKSSGGVNCASGATILTVNGVNGSLLNNANVWAASQTFDATTYFNLSDLQLVFGSPSGTQTTLDIPPTSSNVILHGPVLTASDTLVSENATQILTDKNLTTGTEINGCGVTNGPATYVCIPNNSVTATILNELAIATGAPSTATVAPSSTTSAIIGIVTAGAGITGTATIQQSGIVNCAFDGGTTAGDYFQVSTSVPGNCHDTGAGTYPVAGSGQVLGLVLSTGTGSQSVNLFSPGIVTSPSLINLLGQSAIASTVGGTGAGTGPTIACSDTCTDSGGFLVITTGSSPTGSSATVVTVTFGGTHTAAHCSITPFGAAQALLSAAQVGVLMVEPTAFEIISGASGLTGATQYSWNYVCTFS
jgi:hypothetical protein